MNATVISSTVTPHASATHMQNTSGITNGVSEEERKNGKVTEYTKRKKNIFSNQLSDQTQQCNVVSIAAIGEDDYRKYDLEELPTKMCNGIERDVSLHKTTFHKNNNTYEG